MPEIDKKLPTWNNANQELTFWQREKPINGRGVFMDVQQAEAAVTAVEVQQKVLVTITRELIDNEVQAATQRDTMLKHLTEAFGI
jgi:DNA polymerase bacteriophage-type